jgi:sulfatase maturation enzyme AslB (radical SAM superfamily)
LFPQRNGSKINPCILDNDKILLPIVAKAYKETIDNLCPISSSREICGVGKHTITIDPYGDIYPCNHLKVKIGNALTDNLHSV